jgi:hypothetical protein
LEVSSCLLVLVFANAKTELFQKHISPYLGEWHYRSGDFVEFVFPGYQGLGDPKDHEFKAEVYEDAYQDHVFVKATEVFQSKSGWRYSGEPTVIICNARVDDAPHGDPSRAELQLSSCIEFDLAEALRNGAIPSVPKFFQGIIAFAKANPDRNTVWNYSDVIGIQSLLDRLKDGLVKSLSKWLKLDDTLPPTLQVAKYFAVRNLVVHA